MLDIQEFALTTENGKELSALHEAAVKHFAPANEFEAELVMEMTIARWRLRRVWKMEAAIFEFKMEELNGYSDSFGKEYRKASGDTKTARAFSSLANTSSALTALNRYENRARRSFERALKDLTRFQAERKAAAQEELQNEPKAVTVEPAIKPPAEIVQNEPKPSHPQPKKGKDTRDITNIPRC